MDTPSLSQACLVLLNHSAWEFRGCTVLSRSILPGTTGLSVARCFCKSIFSPPDSSLFPLPNQLLLSFWDLRSLLSMPKSRIAPQTRHNICTDTHYPQSNLSSFVFFALPCELHTFQPLIHKSKVQKVRETKSFNVKSSANLSQLVITVRHFAV